MAAKFLLLTAPPTDGQYIEVWKHLGKIWSETHRIEDGERQSYDTIRNTWRHNPGIHGLESKFISILETHK